MKKNHGLYLITVGITVFVCYFLAGAVYAANNQALSYFLEKAWIMPVVSAVLSVGGAYIFIRAEK